MQKYTLSYNKDEIQLIKQCRIFRDENNGRKDMIIAYVPVESNVEATFFSLDNIWVIKRHDIQFAEICFAKDEL